MNKKLFLDIYNEFFNEKITINDFSLEEQHLKRFKVLVINGSHKEFQKDSLWRIARNFLGEFCSDLQSKGLNKCDWLSFDKKELHFFIDYRAIFILLILLKRDLEKEISLNKKGFPDWFKDENYHQFYRHIRYLTNNEQRIREILKGRPNIVQYFSSQKSVLNYIKGNLNTEKVNKIIKIAQFYNVEKLPRGFRDVKEIDKSSVKLYELVKSDFIENKKKLKYSQAFIDSEWKKLQITVKKCKRYILYLGLMSTIQTFHKKPLELQSVEEKKVFRSSYSYLRSGCFKLKWLICTDPTFCPGVKTKTFDIRVMNPVINKVSHDLYLNPIELGYYTRMFKDREKFAESRSEFANRYLKEKIKIYDLQLNSKQYGFNIRKNLLLIKSYSEVNGKIWKNTKYNDIRYLQSERTVIQYKKIEFYCKFSDRKIYNWQYIPRKNTLLYA